MFTGIIGGTGRVRALERAGAGARLTVSTGLDLDAVEPGDSLCVSGACLTVTGRDADGFRADLSPETLSRTTLGDLEPGAAVNLETPLRAGEPLGGHLVTGHVDGIGLVEERQARDGFERWRIRVPAALRRYLAEKGSLCVDGVSLTVNGLEDDRVLLDLVPHTLAVTTLGQTASGSRVNLEVDLVARYVERLLSFAG